MGYIPEVYQHPSPRLGRINNGNDDTFFCCHLAERHSHHTTASPRLISAGACHDSWHKLYCGSGSLRPSKETGNNSVPATHCKVLITQKSFYRKDIPQEWKRVELLRAMHTLYSLFQIASRPWYSCVLDSILLVLVQTFQITSNRNYGLGLMMFQLRNTSKIMNHFDI
jgi:hypothetical protein